MRERDELNGGGFLRGVGTKSARRTRRRGRIKGRTGELFPEW